ncbi:MAG TPA: exopolyphosphatase [Anseongella sp.]|nr:exopolyphosphatase [Anseongella sp.]
MRYASIDIGSNAVRMMIADIIESAAAVTYKKNTLIRVPLRLGDDAFIDKRLSERKADALIKAMEAFKHLMEIYKVNEYMACATAAMREAANGPEIIEKIKERTGLELKIITGETEAGIIYSNHLDTKLDRNKNYLYIDVGGGSTELSVFTQGKMQASASFDIGTIRMLDNKDSEETWMEMKNFVRKSTKDLKNISGIGTGGNINKLFKLSEEKDGEPLSFSKLKSVYEHLKSYSLKDRINVLGLNQDRADVIIPASEIFLAVMKWGGIKQIYVPRKGLVDGIISLLIEKNFKK